MVNVKVEECLFCYLSHFFFTEACVYNGQSYRQGQKWKDSCLFECECFDESTGRYRCTEV